MRPPPNKALPSESNLHLLLAYVADLELEVDRLRRQGQFLHHEVREAVRRVQQLCAGAAAGGTPRRRSPRLPRPPLRWRPCCGTSRSRPATTAKLLVEQSGGALTVDSDQGQGTTFVAVLPRYDVDEYLV
jgi:hypothetical protein